MTGRDGPVQIGIVGCGEVTRFKHLVVLQNIPGLQVAALADLDADRLRTVAERYGISHQYRDISELLAHPNLDAIGVCVPAHSHASVALAAVGADKHVLIEKPLCLTLDEADRLSEQVDHSRGQFMVGFHMRFHRLIGKARQLLQNGVLGTVESIRTVWNSPRIKHQNPELRFRRERGGGVLVEIAVHCFDLWRFLLNSDVTEIYASSRHGQRDDESLAVTAKMDNGMLASGLFSETTPHEIEVEICGSAGRVRLSCLRFDGFEFLPADAAPGQLRPRLNRFSNFLRELPSGLWSMRTGGDYFDSYKGEWTAFRDLIRDRASIGATLDDGRRSLEVVLAARQSINSGEPVKIANAPRQLPSALPGEAFATA